MLYLVSGFCCIFGGVGCLSWVPFSDTGFVPYLSCELFRRVLFISDCLVVFAVYASGLLFYAVPLVVSSFTICRGIVVVYMWDFKWVVCLVDMVSD